MEPQVNPADISIARFVIIGALAREALDGEAEAWVDAYGGDTDPLRLAQDLRESLEFRRRTLYEHMIDLDRGWGRYFFLHIPKCAGTSLRVALEAAFGIPAALYHENPDLSSTRGRYTGHAPHPRPIAAERWPLLTGHNHLDDYPSGYLGMTVLREPRSRVLSLYRYATAAATIANFVDYDPERAVQFRSWAEMSFSEWLRTYQEEERPAAWWLCPGFAAEPPSSVHELSSDDVRELALQAARRVVGLAWQHDDDGMHNLIRRFSGNPKVKIARDNVTPSPPAQVVLTQEDMQHLNLVTRIDWVMMQSLMELGAIPALSSDEADARLAATAADLNLLLPLAGVPRRLS